MENKLRKLFEYQCFENNSRLEKLINETESRYAAALSDDDLFMVNAAGVIPEELEQLSKNSSQEKN